MLPSHSEIVNLVLETLFRNKGRRVILEYAVHSLITVLTL